MSSFHKWHNIVTVIRSTILLVIFKADYYVNQKTCGIKSTFVKLPLTKFTSDIPKYNCFWNEWNYFFPIATNNLRGLGLCRRCRIVCSAWQDTSWSVTTYTRFSVLFKPLVLHQNWINIWMNWRVSRVSRNASRTEWLLYPHPWISVLKQGLLMAIQNIMLLFFYWQNNAR